MHVCTMSKQNEYQLVRNNAMKLKLKFYYGNTDKQIKIYQTYNTFTHKVQSMPPIIRTNNFVFIQSHQFRFELNVFGSSPARRIVNRNAQVYNRAYVYLYRCTYVNTLICVGRLYICIHECTYVERLSVKFAIRNREPDAVRIFCLLSVFNIQINFYCLIKCEQGVNLRII